MVLVTASLPIVGAAHYNQDGFLRILNHEQDLVLYTPKSQDLIWAFSGEQWRSQTEIANFQQFDAGLAVLAKSLDSMVSMPLNFLNRRQKKKKKQTAKKKKAAKTPPRIDRGQP